MRVRVIVSYCLIVYALSWSLQFAAIHSVGNLESDAAKPWLASGMFIPALVALLFAWKSPSVRAALRWKATWRMLPMLIFAVAVPTALAFGTVAVCEIAGWGKSGWFAFAQDGVTISGRPWILGGGFQSWPKFLANVAATGFFYAAISGLVAMGEELGWRGFLQGALIAKLGATRGIILLGLIWSFWHLPILLAGYNYPDYPLLGAFILFPVTLVAFSFFLGWLTLNANTFWPAALAHGAFNSIGTGVVNNLHMTVPHIYEDLSNLGITVLVGLVYWTLLGKRVDALTEFSFHAATT
jgi:membrane protease YdiL (CAAX protease family)